MSEDTKKLGVNIDGVVVKKLTAFNAAFIRDNKIGPGAILRITRQGDAIPYIKEVIKSSPTGPQYPDKKQIGNYDWNSTKVDFVLLEEGQNNDELNIQRIIRFFNAVGVDYFSEGTIRKLYKAGFTEIPSILKITDKELIKLEGFQEKSIKRIREMFNGFKTKGLDLPTYMYASGCFKRGLGKDKLIKIYETFGDDCITGWDRQTLRDIASSIETIHGFSFETGVQFAKGIKPFMKFAKECGDLISIITPKQASGNKLKGTIALLTGFRDQAIQDFIIDQGGRIASSMNKSVTLLLIKDKSTNNDKTAKAKTMGTPVLTQEEFKNKYM